ncbi:MAG: aspartate kinase [Candidatus Sumerlaeaceae bacterium]|nr:aspartate kinase [Candidatus Sumerlaeaceae bacterium]
MQTPTLVIKFGGTSVGTADAMARAVSIIADLHRKWPWLVVVTSALAGVTDRLLNEALQAAKHGRTEALEAAEAELFSHHHSIIAELLPNELAWPVEQEIKELLSLFVSLVRAIAVLGEATPRALDAVASLGERMSTRLLASACRAQGLAAEAVDATQLIVTDHRFQNAHPDFDATTKRVRTHLRPLLEAGRVPIITGFIGATPEGITTTLGRGGSDYSAAILGATLPAQEVWIYTDVDGVMTADPRLVPQARTLAEISYRELSELAYYGAKVVHPKTVRPAIEAGIGLRILNTFNPQHPGTRVVREKGEANSQGIGAVTAIRKQRLVTIDGRGMIGIPGVAARAFGAVASTGTSVPFITQASSEQSICFSIPAENVEHVLPALEHAFALELANRDIDRIWASEEIAIVTVVGDGMRETPGVAGKIFSALGQENINVWAIAHGSSDVSMSLVVALADMESAVRAIHRLIEEH